MACTSASVRSTAIGSLVPDSVSSVPRRRLGRPRPRRELKTAAASVLDMTAPSSMLVSQSRSVSAWAARPMKTMVSSVPRVARAEAGTMAARKMRMRVSRPP